MRKWQVDNPFGFGAFWGLVLFVVLFFGIILLDTLFG
jgi:hypothetical protein